MKVLLLNATYEPLSTIKIERAMVLLISQKAEVIHSSEKRVIRTVNKEYPCPEVVRLKSFVRVKFKEIAPSKRNIIDRDGECQYCGSKHRLTIDHVIPTSKGGENTWTNLVACCWDCNNKKGDRTPGEWGHQLKRQPFRPTQLSVIKVYSKENKIPSWENYIFI
jgi:5-methylcytosine-specific restriction endonuclease McrA